MYCYFNDGLSWRAVVSDYVAQEGEVLFDHTPTTTELTAVFPGYVDAQKELKIAALDARYKPQFEGLKLAYAGAILSGGDDATVTEIKAEYEALKQEYQTALAAIK